MPVYRTMIGKVFGISTVFVAICASLGFSQSLVTMDSIATDSLFQLYEFRVDIPVGQTFINSGKKHNLHSLRFSVPGNKSQSIISKDTLGRSLRTYVSLVSSKSSNYFSATTTANGTNQMVMRGSMTVEEDPAKYLTELRPAINTPVTLSMKLGHGSTWLDLSDMRVRGVVIESSSADVFLSYKSPNPEKMHLLKISAGMSRIVLRNLEYARAKKIKIDNGMGDTNIIIGEKLYCPSQVQLGVGAGTCTMMVHQNTPIKIILKNNFLSSVEVPENFIKTSDNVYVSLAYKKNPAKAMTVTVNLGIGSYSLFSYK